MRLFPYPVGNTARTSDPSNKLFNASRCSTFSSKENLNLVDNCLKTSIKMSVSAILISGGVVYVIGQSTNGNFASRIWTHNTRRTIGCVQALFPLPPPCSPPRESACSQASGYPVVITILRTLGGIFYAQLFCACNAFHFHHTWAVFVQHSIANILKCILF